MELDLARTQTRRLVKSVTVNRPSSRSYQEWRNLAHRQTAQATDYRRSMPGASAPTIKAPAIAETGTTTSGMAELSLEIPGTLIAWKSLPFEGTVQTGEVWFSSVAQEQTEVRLIFTWQDGVNHTALLTDTAAAQMELDLMRFKRHMEG